MTIYKRKIIERIVLIVTCVAVVCAVLIIGIKRKYKVEIGEPIVIGSVEGATETLPWGFFQFPKLYYSTEGSIICQIAYKNDSIDSYDGKYLFYMSSNQGKHWDQVADKYNDTSLLMENECYLQGAEFVNAFESDLVEKYESVYKYDDKSLFDGSLISESDYSTKFNCIEYNPKQKTNDYFTSTIEWPHRPIRIINGLTCPSGMVMYPYSMHTSNSIIKENDGSLLMAVYSEGFDSETGEIVYNKHYNIYLFRSFDSARTWKYVGQILTKPIYCEEQKEGFCEPVLQILKNGIYFILMRTGSGAPLYCAYSYDQGSTWVDIQKFADIGVDPQLLQLNCGVTLASYGRPGIYIRTTDDIECKVWEKPQCILEDSPSCCYTSLIALNDNKALLAYSKFEYLDDNNTIIKRIIAREITISYYLEWQGLE